MICHLKRDVKLRLQQNLKQLFLFVVESGRKSRLINGISLVPSLEQSIPA